MWTKALLATAIATIMAIAVALARGRAPRPQLERSDQPPQADHGAHSQQLRLVLARLKLAEQQTAQLAALQARVSALELRLKELGPAREPATKPPSHSDDRKESEVPLFSNTTLGEWMEGTLRDDLDHEWTDKATSEFEDALAGLPELTLEDVECGRRFCRATLFKRDGVAPELQEFSGALPFLQEGFTAPSSDGRVAFYFTREGETLARIREDAKRSPQHPL